MDCHGEGGSHCAEKRSPLRYDRISRLDGMHDTTTMQYADAAHAPATSCDRDMARAAHAFAHLPTAMRLVFDNIDDAIFLHDVTGEIIEMNLPACAMYGVTHDEGLCLSIMDHLSAPENPFDTLPAIWARVIAGESASFEWRARRPHDGHLFDVDVFLRAIPVLGETLVMAVVHDSTERNRREKVLRRSEAFAHAVIDSLAAHICVLDEHGVIVAVNAAWRDFARANAGHICSGLGPGTNYLALCEQVTGAEADAARAFAAGIRAVMRGELPAFTHEYPCHALPETSWFVGHITRYTGEDGAHVVIAHENITRRKEAEQAMIEAERLKSTLISSVSHSLKSPLAIITARTSNLLDPANCWNPEEIRDDLQSIHEEALRVNHRITALLEISTLEAHAVDMQREWYEFGEILGSVMEELPAREHPRIRFAIPDNLPPIYVDFRYWARALLHLTENALAYCPAPTAIVVGAAPTPHGVRLWVEDAGPGIPEDEREHVFEKFYRGRAGVTTRSGSGLGLAITAEIIRSHQGDIHVENVAPHGTRFVITLPGGTA